MGIHNSAYSELLSIERLKSHDVFNIFAFVLHAKKETLSQSHFRLRKGRSKTRRFNRDELVTYRYSVVLVEVQSGIALQLSQHFH